MASNSAADAMSPDAVLAAMMTMRGGDATRKQAAMDYLSSFQKSVCHVSPFTISIPLCSSSPSCVLTMRIAEKRVGYHD